MPRALSSRFHAMKLKVGSEDLNRDLRRVEILRDQAGPHVRCMVDANQQWSLPRALEFGRRAKDFNLYRIEEPTHPTHLLAHRTIAEQIAPGGNRRGRACAKSRPLQELFADGLPGILPGRCLTRGRVSDHCRQHVSETILCAGRAARGRHGAASSALSIIQSCRIGNTRHSSWNIFPTSTNTLVPRVVWRAGVYITPQIDRAKLRSGGPHIGWPAMGLLDILGRRCLPGRDCRPRVLGCSRGSAKSGDADQAKDYFLAGRILKWPVIGLALFATKSPPCTWWASPKLATSPDC